MGVQQFSVTLVRGVKGWGNPTIPLAILSMAAVLAGCRSEAKVEGEVVRPVKVAVVQAAASGRMLTYSGVVRARIESAIGFRVAGKIVERAVSVGDLVWLAN